MSWNSGPLGTWLPASRRTRKQAMAPASEASTSHSVRRVTAGRAPRCGPPLAAGDGPPDNLAGRAAQSFVQTPHDGSPGNGSGPSNGT
jgi:hypothetical protein